MMELRSNSLAEKVTVMGNKVDKHHREIVAARTPLQNVARLLPSLHKNIIELKKDQTKHETVVNTLIDKLDQVLQQNLSLKTSNDTLTAEIEETKKRLKALEVVMAKKHMSAKNEQPDQQQQNGEVTTDVKALVDETCATEEENDIDDDKIDHVLPYVDEEGTNVVIHVYSSDEFSSEDSRNDMMKQRKKTIKLAIPYSLRYNSAFENAMSQSTISSNVRLPLKTSVLPQGPTALTASPSDLPTSLSTPTLSSEISTVSLPTLTLPNNPSLVSHDAFAAYRSVVTTNFQEPAPSTTSIGAIPPPDAFADSTDSQPFFDKSLTKSSRTTWAKLDETQTAGHPTTNPEVAA